MNRKSIRIIDRWYSVEIVFHVLPGQKGYSPFIDIIYSTLGYHNGSPILRATRCETDFQRWLVWRDVFQHPEDEAPNITGLLDEVKRVNILLMEWYIRRRREDR